MGRYVQPSRRGILGRQWAGLVENALCTNSVQPVTDPERYSSSVGLNAQSDVAAVQLANHRFQIEPLPHVKSPSQRVRNARGATSYAFPEKSVPKKVDCPTPDERASGPRSAAIGSPALRSWSAAPRP
jgi:hypothetical protein